MVRRVAGKVTDERAEQLKKAQSPIRVMLVAERSTEVRPVFLKAP